MSRYTNLDVGNSSSHFCHGNIACVAIPLPWFSTLWTARTPFYIIQKIGWCNFQIWKWSFLHPNEACKWNQNIATKAAFGSHVVHVQSGSTSCQDNATQMALWGHSELPMKFVLSFQVWKNCFYDIRSSFQIRPKNGRCKVGLGISLD